MIVIFSVLHVSVLSANNIKCAGGSSLPGWMNHLSEGFQSNIFFKASTLEERDSNNKSFFTIQSNHESLSVLLFFLHHWVE